MSGFVGYGRIIKLFSGVEEDRDELRDVDVVSRL